MRDKSILLWNYTAAAGREPFPVALYREQLYLSDHFAGAVGRRAQVLRREPDRRYAFYTQEAYPFAVGLFALLHAGKEAWIPGNNLPETAGQLEREGCRLLGDWPGSGPFEAESQATGWDEAPEPLDPNASRIVLFTSGSEGLPKTVPKNLRQLQAEVDALENLWGGLLRDAWVAGTVSHQHIYGLLFRVLWPLSAGRCFHSAVYTSPEALLADGRAAKTCWIASPSHLKRLDERSPWPAMAKLPAIFSSGGPLPADAAAQIFRCAGRSVIEVYGSTETGGIAWRETNGRADAPWQPFAGVRLEWTGGRPHVYSPYLPGGDGLALDDRLTQLDDGRLLLHGRQDRIVKVEEKRVSLTALERSLQETPWIAEAYALVMARRRDIVAVAAVLSEAGSERLQEMGRNALIKHLRSALAGRFDAVALPRKWLFVNRLPLTAQGKVDREMLTFLLQSDARSLPRVLAADTETGCARLFLKVPKALRYFPDHFPDFPLLPGVVQIGWAEHFGKLFFPAAASFSHMEAVKFGKMIRPEDELYLDLEWRESSRKLCFRYTAGNAVCSSGRLCYGDGS